MIFLRLLCILMALIVLLCLVRVGVHVDFTEECVFLKVRLGWFRIQVLPGKGRKEESAEKEKKQRRKKRPPSRKAKKEQPKLTFADIKEAARALFPPLKRALARTRKGIRINPLDLRFTIGAADDPAAGAELYGYLHSGIWTVMPILEQLLVIPNPHLHVGIDFDHGRNILLGRACVTLRIGTLLAVAFGVGIPALKWLLAFSKKEKQVSGSEKTSAADTQKG